MKTKILVLLLLFLIGLGAGTVAYFQTRCCKVDVKGCSCDPMLWLRQEFDLTETQLQKIEALYNAQAMGCDIRAQRIGEAKSVLKKLSEEHAPQSEIDAAAAKLAKLNTECWSNVDAHVHAVAEIMGPEKGARYLSLVLPKVQPSDQVSPSASDAKSESSHEGCDKH